MIVNKSTENLTLLLNTKNINLPPNGDFECTNTTGGVSKLIVKNDNGDVVWEGWIPCDEELRITPSPIRIITKGGEIITHEKKGKSWWWLVVIVVTLIIITTIIFMF